MNSQFLHALYRTLKQKIFKYPRYHYGVRRLPLLLFSVYCYKVKDNLKKTEFQDSKNLSHEFLIQQATSASVSAAMQLLNQSVVAVIDTTKRYRDTVLILLSLYEEARIAKGFEARQQELSDEVIKHRSELEDIKRQLSELETLLQFVEKMVVSTAEVTFLAGSEHISVSLTERLHSSKQELEKNKKEIQVLEQELLSLQSKLINETPVD